MQLHKKIWNLGSDLLKLFQQRRTAGDIVGVQLNADGVALVQTTGRNPHPEDEGRPSFHRCEWFPESDPLRQQRWLTERVAQYGLSRRPCHLVLSRSDVSLLLVEAPAVPAAELREALRWRIRDLIDFPVEEAVLDAFLLPEDRPRPGHRMAYVAVARRALIARRVEQMTEARLSLQVIDIPELALRNLVRSIGEAARGVALLRLQGGTGALHIVRDGSLHLARRFNVPYEGGLLEDLPGDVLLLEVQRSLDYFERQMRQPPPACLWLTGENVTDDKLPEVLIEGLAIPVDALALENRVLVPGDIMPHTLALCAEAMGAALRLPEPDLREGEAR